MPVTVTREHFGELVQQAMTQLPPQFREALEVVRVEVHDQPTPEQIDDLGLGDDELLMGLFEGIPLTESSVEHSGVMPGVIYLFREDICEICTSEDDLVEQVKITLFH